jgi:hypothetical protein
MNKLFMKIRYGEKMEFIYEKQLIISLKKAR